jgi:cytochrome oxidase assembly protein ShyY1
MYVDLIESSPPEPEPFPEPVAAPELSEGSHLSYAVQWFVFATAVAVGWVLAVRRSARSQGRPDEVGQPAPVDAERQPAPH